VDSDGVQIMDHAQLSEEWTNIPIAQIEDLRNAVYGAGLEATQMSTALLSGDLAFAQHGSVLYSSGLIHGQIALRGPLSQDQLTVGVGLRLGAGTRHWLEETDTGAVGVFCGGDEHDAFYTPGSLYATATLSMECLEEMAASEELVLDRRVLGGTGIHPRLLTPATVRRLRQAFELVHCGRPAVRRGGARVGESLLRAIIIHIGRDPIGRNERGGGHGHARFVKRARAYILEHLRSRSRLMILPTRPALLGAHSIVPSLTSSTIRHRPMSGVCAYTAFGTTSPATRSGHARSHWWPTNGA
jgi:hypothetical protein